MLIQYVDTVEAGDEATVEVEEEAFAEVGMLTHQLQLFHQLTHKPMRR
jgi:hypothetical protein